MAKNLKLNIKNTQLAEALNLSKPKKKSPPIQEEAQLPPEPIAEISSRPEPEAEPVSMPKEILEPLRPELPVEAVVKTSPESTFSDSEQKRPPVKRMLPGFVKREKDAGGYRGSRPITNFNDRNRNSPDSRPPRDPNSPTSFTRDSRPEYNRSGEAPRPPRSFSDRPSTTTPRTTRPGEERNTTGFSRPFQDRSSPFTREPRRDGTSSFPPRREGSSPFPPRREGTSSYPPRREGSAPFTPRRDGPRTTGFKPDDRPSRPTPPPKELGGKEIPQQHQVHKKHTTPATDRDSNKSAIKKAAENRSFDARDRQGLRDGEDGVWRKKKISKHKHLSVDEIVRPKELKIRLPIILKDLAAEMKLKATELISKLFMQGVVLTLNDYLDDETTIQLLGHEFGCEITIDTSEEEKVRVTDKTIKQEIEETDPALLELRPPVVTFMGHVDHGKTSLIDAIRKANVVATEAGAITQHIGAFKCHTQVGLLTILDTPGHEAFSSMRERGAEVTDIVVLVIAGDEGIKTQTIEAIAQAKQAGVCLVVAINKCDKPNFDVETVYRQLAEQDLLPEAWGGSVITVSCSATTGEGLTALLEMLALQSEILELKANATARARGSVIESEMHKGLGAVATILVQNGTLRVGDAMVFGRLYARVKTLYNEFGKEIPEAGPSTPVKITGLSGVPTAGSEFIVVKNEKEAKEIAEKRTEGHQSHLLQQAKKTNMENLLQNKAEAGEKKILNLILKADVQGSLEALKNSLSKLPSKKVQVNFIIEGVGEISESDIQYANSSKAVILGFHTKVESHAESLIKQNKTDVRLHDIIYHAVDDIRAIMLGLLDKIPEENEIGEAVVKTVFKSSQIGSIAGCQVSTGVIRRGCQAKVIREKEVVWKGQIASLKRVKEDVKEVQKGIECGIVLQGFNDYKEGDIIQVSEIRYLQQELE